MRAAETAKAAGAKSLAQVAEDNGITTEGLRKRFRVNRDKFNEAVMYSVNKRAEAALGI